MCGDTCSIQNLIGRTRWNIIGRTVQNIITMVEKCKLLTMNSKDPYDACPASFCRLSKWTGGQEFSKGCLAAHISRMLC